MLEISSKKKTLIYSNVATGKYILLIELFIKYKKNNVRMVGVFFVVVVVVKKREIVITITARLKCYLYCAIHGTHTEIIKLMSPFRCV